MIMTQQLRRLTRLVLFTQALLFLFPLSSTSQEVKTQTTTSTTTTTATTTTPTSSNLASTTTTTTIKGSGWASNDVVLEFDESDVQNLSLKLKWRYKSTSGESLDNASSIPTRFVLLMETKRINFSTFLFDYSSPQLIDDEQVRLPTDLLSLKIKLRFINFLLLTLR